MSKLSDIVRAKREELGLNQKDFANLLGYSQSAVSDIENGTTTTPRNANRLAKILGISTEALDEIMLESSRDMAGEINRRRLPAGVKEAIARVNSAAPAPDRYVIDEAGFHYAGRAPTLGRRDVPVLGRAAGGADGRFEFNGEIMGWEVRPPQLEGVIGAYCIYVSGSSMHPRYRDGETAWVNPNKPPRSGDDVVVQFYPGEEAGVPSGFVKELVGYRGNKIVLAQHNPPKELEFDRNKVMSIHLIEFAQR
jgi:phage repressor protein C with HTH and peptisase S24 domain